MEIFETIYSILSGIATFFSDGLANIAIPAEFGMIVGIVMIVWGLFACLFGKRCFGFVYFISVIVFCATIVGPVAYPVVEAVLAQFGQAAILESIPYCANIIGAVIGLILALCGKHGFRMTLFTSILVVVIRPMAYFIESWWDALNMPVPEISGFSGNDLYTVLAIIVTVLVAYFLTYAIEPATKLIGSAFFGAALAVAGVEYAFKASVESMLGANYVTIVAIVFAALFVLGLLIQLISAIRRRGSKGYDYDDED